MFFFSKSKIRIVLTNTGQGSNPDYGEFAVVERTITQTASSYTLKAMTGTGRDRKGTNLLALYYS